MDLCKEHLQNRLTEEPRNSFGKWKHFKSDEWYSLSRASGFVRHNRAIVSTLHPSLVCYITIPFSETTGPNAAKLINTIYLTSQDKLKIGP